MSNNKNGCLEDANDLFEKLSSWSEESHGQITKIITSHNSSIRKGIRDLAEEVDGLQAELSIIKKERTVLLETVDNLNGEIRQLNAKLQPEEEPNHDVVEAGNYDEEKSNDTQQDQESSGISKEYDDPDINTDYGTVSERAINQQNKSTLDTYDSLYDSILDESEDEDVDNIENIPINGQATEDMIV